jgi:hypothetical protein
MKPASESRRAVVERGVSAILVALMLVPMIGFVALGIDISQLHNDRQRLWDTIDAAALAGASQLPDATAARAAALAYADANISGLTPALEFRCLVGVTSLGLPDGADVPVSCNPGPGPDNLTSYPGITCSAEICSIPCNPDPPENDECNTMLVSASRTVDYNFAPVIGFDSGDTGTLSTAACRGVCGSVPDAPADIVLLLDRTGSMGAADMVALDQASKAFLEGLTPSLHHVALGTLGRSSNSPSPACPTDPSPDQNSGPWIPVGLRSDYDITDNNPPDSPPNLNGVSLLVMGIDCLPKSSTGTNLGDPIAAAGSYLLANGRAGVSKGIVFLTDGEANRSSSGQPCDWAKSRAQLVEDSGVAIIAIAYRLQGVSCNGEPATQTLAKMASDPTSGPASADDGGDGLGGLAGGCLGAPEIASENSDGDHLFCAPDPSQLVATFDAASSALLADLDARTKLVRIPT